MAVETTVWPPLPRDAWKDSLNTLHLYTQIIGKLRLALSPKEPEWAHVPLYVTSRGLTTSPIPFGIRTFEIQFDFIAHELNIDVSDGQSRTIKLVPRTVAEFYDDVMENLRGLEIEMRINAMPQEIQFPIPFTDDVVHGSYDPEYVRRFWEILSRIDALLKQHRAPYRGRHTLVQFFWGTFDLSYARYSGRVANPPPNSGTIMRHAMDAEEVCVGFWPGDDRFPEPAFWCYTYPRPQNIEKAAIRPSAAFWNEDIGEFMLRYEDVRKLESPAEAILDFFRSTYEAGAQAGGWT